MAPKAADKSVAKAKAKAEADAANVVETHALVELALDVSSKEADGREGREGYRFTRVDMCCEFHGVDVREGIGRYAHVAYR